jgi:hypothetical protein
LASLYVRTGSALIGRASIELQCAVVQPAFQNSAATARIRCDVKTGQIGLGWQFERQPHPRVCCLAFGGQVHVEVGVRGRGKGGATIQQVRSALTVVAARIGALRELPASARLHDLSFAPADPQVRPSSVVTASTALCPM